MIEIEMTDESTLRDLQLLMYTLEVLDPVPVTLDAHCCHAANQERYGPAPVTSWVKIQKPTSSNVVNLRASRVHVVPNKE